MLTSTPATGASPPSPTPPSSSPPSPTRVPALDGLRAIAMLLVLGYHLGGSTKFAGGWVSMDVFFALSGFLITSLLVGEHHRTGTIGLRRFYVRRFRRLGPALVVILSAVMVWAWVRGGVETFSTLRREALATLLYVANWNLIVTDRSYFASFQESPLLHTWSLAVEEQFYVVWPLLFVVLARVTRMRPARLLAALAVLLAASATWMAFVSRDGGDPSRAYFGSDTRAQALIAGCMLAVAVGPGGVRRRPGPAAATAIGLAALAGWAALVLTLDENARWVYTRGGFVVISAVAVALVYACTVVTTGPVAAVLGNRWLCRFGVRTYSFYLWHWPVIVFLAPPHVNLSPFWLDLLRVAVTLALTEITFRLVEHPIHTGRLRIPRPQVAVPSAILATFAIVVVTTTGNSAATSSADTSGILIGDAEAGAAEPADNGLPDVLLLGDSSAWVIGGNVPADLPFRVSTVFHAQCDVIGDVIYTGDQPFESSDSCADRAADWAAGLASADPDVVIVSFGLRQLFDLAVDGRRVHVGSDEWRRAFDAGIVGAVAEIRATTDAPIRWLEVPCFTWAAADTDGEEHDAHRIDTVNARLAAVLAAAPDAELVGEYRRWLCDGDDLSDSIAALRPDGAHLTPEASNELWSRLDLVIRAAVGEDVGPTRG